MNILQMTGWFALIIANVYYDYRKIRTNKGINHVAETIVRIFVGILYAGIVFGVRAPNEHAQWVIIFQATSFFLFFELLLNLARGLHPFYIGKTSVIDKFLDSHKFIWLFVKVVSLALFVTSVVQLIKGN